MSGDIIIIDTDSSSSSSNSDFSNNLPSDRDIYIFFQRDIEVDESELEGVNDLLKIHRFQHGKCLLCGIQTHFMAGNRPLSTLNNQDVLYGRCLSCYPLPSEIPLPPPDNFEIRDTESFGNIVDNMIARKRLRHGECPICGMSTHHLDRCNLSLTPKFDQFVQNGHCLLCLPHIIP